MNRNRSTLSSWEHRSLSVLILLVLCLSSPNVFAGSLCGNSMLNPGETCDDGNNDSGDGCSQLCQVEAGYQCTDPYVELGPSEIIVDGGFESGPDGEWENASSIGPLVCSTSECPSTPAGARNGAHWAQLGGVAEQTWALVQNADFNDQARLLKFDVMHFSCPPPGSNDLFGITLDGNAVWLSGATDPGCFNGQRYVTTIVDLDTVDGGPYANAGNLEVALQLMSNTGQLTMAIDNVEIGKLAGSPQASICTIDPDVSLYQPFEDIDGPLSPPDFQQEVLGEFALFWGTTSDGVCGTNQSPPGNHTGEPGDAACIDSTFLPPLPNRHGDSQSQPMDINRLGIEQANTQLANVIETYVCNAPVDLSFKLQSSLQLVVNYQPGPQSSQDFFGVWVAPSPFFGPLSSGANSARLLVNDPQGVFGQSPGVSYELDISDLDGQPQVYVCFGYGNEGAGYAQVDTVILSSDGCTDDFEEDKILGCTDNCINVINPSQLDSDNDGYGNACDADIAKNGAGSSSESSSSSGNDCLVNFADLFTFSQAMFSDPTRENWNPDADFNDDGFVNFLDLSIFSNQFLQAPGPSGVTATCSVSQT